MRYLRLIVVCLVASLPALAQNGGKAEPLRIQFPKGKTSTTLSRRLSRDQEMEYVFAAKGGQKVSVTNTTNSAFDFRIFNEEQNVETEFESSRTFSLELPADGDYMLFVRKKAGGPKSAVFRVTLSIK